MKDDPFQMFILDALNLLHPRFAARGASARVLLFELYHQLRHLWDRAVPVQLGLGHVLFRVQSDAPELHFERLGEHGAADAPLGVVALTRLADHAGIDAALERLVSMHKTQSYPNIMCVVVGRATDVPASGLPEAPGVTTIFFDVGRWCVA